MEKYRDIYLFIKNVAIHVPVLLVTARLYYECAQVLRTQEKNTRRKLLIRAFFMLWLFWIVCSLPYAAYELYWTFAHKHLVIHRFQRMHVSDVMNDSMGHLSCQTLTNTFE